MAIRDKVSGLGNIRIGPICGFLIRVLLAAGVLWGGFLGWSRLAYPGKWPLPGGVLTAIHGAWASFSLCMVFAVAVILDPTKYTAKKKRGLDDSRRSNLLEMGTQRLRTRTKTLKQGEPLLAWEPILQAAQLEIEMALGLVGREIIQTNLVLAQPETQLCVVARSRPHIRLPIRFAYTGDLMAGKAIAENTTVVQLNVRKLPGMEVKPYNCVAVTPIAHGSKAYGAISADSKHSKTFKGRAALVDSILRPYCALVLLTLDSDACYYPCPEHNVR